MTFDRKHAEVIAAQSYERSSGYNWWAAAKTAGLIPNKREYMSTVVRLAQQLEPNDAKQGALQAIKWESKRLASDTVGIIGQGRNRPKGERFFVKYIPMDPTWRSFEQAQRVHTGGTANDVPYTPEFLERVRKLRNTLPREDQRRNLDRALLYGDIEDHGVKKRMQAAAKRSGV